MTLQNKFIFARSNFERYSYQIDREKRTGEKIEVPPQALVTVFAGGCGLYAFAPRLQNFIVSHTHVPQGVKYIANHPAGPFTSQGLAPSFKWMLSVSNILDLDRPVEKISTAQQTALCATGFIWSRYAFVITPVNYNLFAVNIVLAMTGTYHLMRKIKSQSRIGS
eukprot:TRINITY_DN9287_c0_g1_i2.p1 TRINITY_DN9287_c0_g1~~TRINITY_DN9287_c0_g1_i2.p1  ORF type:complete len:165 (-),score=27.95 TRINITY_DN9287_c0_g1_i2:130-624(-)